MKAFKIRKFTAIHVWSFLPQASLLRASHCGESKDAEIISLPLAKGRASQKQATW